MLTKNENFVRMAQAVAKVLENNAVVWAQATNFSGNVNSLKGLLKTLGETKQMTQQKSTGATLDKLRLEDNAINTGVNLAQRAAVYALDKNNMQLYNQLNLSKSELKQMHDNNCIAQLRSVFSLMTPIISDLKNYSVTDKELAQMKSNIDAFEKSIIVPRQIVVERKSHNQLSKETLAQMRFLFLKLDKQINIFADTQLEREYKNARIIIDLGGRFEDDEDTTEEPTKE